MTAVATFGPTPVPCDLVPVPPKKHRNFRIEDRVWFAFARIAELQRERTSERARRLLADDVRKNYRLIKNDPVWLAKLRELDELDAQSDDEG
jgi:hypothetical protein